jgi:hypothetical protein|tara:strand:- start:205 stop:456 length:252 start_codon:yes stop_codon:yes gene_type:complete
VTLCVVPLTAKIDFDEAILGSTGFSAPRDSLIADEIRIVKAVAPVITLLEDFQVSLELGSTYTDAGGTAVDCKSSDEVGHLTV